MGTRRADPADMQAANAMQSIMYDLFSLTGPAGRRLDGFASPEAAIVFAAGALLLADVGFGAAAAGAAWRPRPGPYGDLLGALRFTGLRTLVACWLPAGLAIGIIEIAAPAFADEGGNAAPARSLWPPWQGRHRRRVRRRGSMTWRVPAVVRHGRLSLALIAELGARRPPVAAMLAVPCSPAGPAFGPITTIFGRLDELVAAPARTEAFTWVIVASLRGSRSA